MFKIEKKMEKVIQITSGRGPEECCRVVAKVQELMMKQSTNVNVKIEVLDQKKGDLAGTFHSVTLLAKGADLELFLKEWSGTVQWAPGLPVQRAGWIALALVISLLCWLYSRRLAGQSGLL